MQTQARIPTKGSKNAPRLLEGGAGPFAALQPPHAAGGCYAWRTSTLYGDLFRLRVFGLGQRDRQHALVILGGDFVLYHLRRQRDRAGETAIAAFDAMVQLALLLLLFLRSPPTVSKLPLS